MVCRGLSIFWLKNNIYSPPPFLKMMFSPLLRHVVLASFRALFSFILPYFALFFTLLLPFCSFSSPFFHFLPPSSFFFPVFPFYSPFFLFFNIFPFFLFPFRIFSPKWHWLIFPPPGWGERERNILQYMDPWWYVSKNSNLRHHKQVRASP